MRIELTRFVMRQFDSKFAGTKMHKVDVEAFVNLCNESIDSESIDDDVVIRNHKYWNFCKYLFIKNYDYANNIKTDINTSVIKLDHTNCQYVQSGYSSRTPSELSVLSRWIEFPKTANYKAPTAKWIGVVLYSKEQLLQEHNDNPSGEPFELSEDCEYGIVAIMGLNQPEMEPMPPITHLRNALGTEQGGNGTPINKEEYEKSVQFWQEHIMVK